MIKVVRKLNGLSSIGHFLSNTEYKAQLNPAEIASGLILHLTPGNGFFLH